MIPILHLAIFIILFLIGCDANNNKYHIDILSNNPLFEKIIIGFKKQMSAFGYVEGIDIVYNIKDYNNYIDAMRNEDAIKPASKNVDLIFSLFTEATLVAKEATREMNIPLVFAYAGIEESRLVNSIREPGGRITGVRYPGPEQISKRLDILTQIAPNSRRVFIVYDRDYPNTGPALTMLRALSKTLAVTLVEAPVDDLEGMESALQACDQSTDPGMDAILLMPDAINHSVEGWKMIRDFGASHDLPIAGSFPYTVEQGALFGNADDLEKVGRLAAPLVHKILQGIPAGTIPVITPEQELFINVKRAHELGLEVPEGLLRQAEEILR